MPVENMLKNRLKMSKTALEKNKVCLKSFECFVMKTVCCAWKIIYDGKYERGVYTVCFWRFQPWKFNENRHKSNENPIFDEFTIYMIVFQFALSNLSKTEGTVK